MAELLLFKKPGKAKNHPKRNIFIKYRIFYS